MVTQLHPGIHELIARIAESAPARVILFGSYARNIADPESDVDLLILFRELQDRRATSARMYRRLAGSALPKDIVIATVEEFERYKDVPNTIFWIAARHGQLVYDG
jgi:predicted nucleotidyltransferase